MTSTICIHFIPEVAKCNHTGIWSLIIGCICSSLDCVCALNSPGAGWLICSACSCITCRICSQGASSDITLQQQKLNINKTDRSLLFDRRSLSLTKRHSTPSGQNPHHMKVKNMVMWQQYIRHLPVIPTGTAYSCLFQIKKKKKSAKTKHYIPTLNISNNSIFKLTITSDMPGGLTSSLL